MAEPKQRASDYQLAGVFGIINALKERGHYITEFKVQQIIYKVAIPGLAAAALCQDTSLHFEAERIRLRIQNDNVVQYHTYQYPDPDLVDKIDHDLNTAYTKVNELYERVQSRTTTMDPRRSP